MIALPTEIAFDAAGLVPVVVQDRASGDVLMLAYANEPAVIASAETGYAHFWSRSRGALWKKGETSGHVLRLLEVRRDCDGDALLFVVTPEGPTCHTGTRSCFGDAPASAAGVLSELERVIDDRVRRRPAGSYVASLFLRGPDAALKKVGEEATEVVLAAKGESDDRLAEEAADLVFHLLVALRQRGVALSRVVAALEERRPR